MKKQATKKSGIGKIAAAILLAVIVLFGAVGAAVYYNYQWQRAVEARIIELIPSDGKDGADGAPGEPGKDGTDGKDGQTPHIGENGNWFIGEIDTGVKAAGTDGADGAPGADGIDGNTPYIGDNGNWFIGEIDTGIKAEGQDGESPTPLYAHLIKIGYVYCTFVTARATPYVGGDFKSLYEDLIAIGNTAAVALSVSGGMHVDVNSSPGTLLIAEECYISINLGGVYYAEVRCRRFQFTDNGAVLGSETEINSNDLHEKCVYPLFVPASD